MNIIKTITYPIYIIIAMAILVAILVIWTIVCVLKEIMKWLFTINTALGKIWRHDGITEIQNLYKEETGI